VKPSKDYYKILGVQRDASADDVKKAYRKQAMQYHPDRNPGKEQWANERFKEINEAFSVLGDPKKKKRYDRYGTAEGIDIGDMYSNPFTRGTVDDLMKDFGGAGLRFDFLNGIFGGLFGGQGATFGGSGRSGRARFSTRPGERVDFEDLMGRRGQSKPVRYELTISADEARTGARKVLSRKGKKLEVDIPAAVKTGSVVKLRNALQSTDGRPGDILIRIKVTDGSGASI
jgi:DnaJ-class molecular chaperone